MSLPRLKPPTKRDCMPDNLWEQMKQHMPIPCVDVVLENSRGEILLGWRRIQPYRNVWALPGGRVFKGEKVQVAARRIIAEYGLSARELFLVGVFPVRFHSRSDFSVCVAGRHPKGKAKPEGVEFSSFRWVKRLPTRLGANYIRMILRWRQMKRKTQTLEFGKL